MYKISDNVIKFMAGTMKKDRMELTGEKRISRGENLERYIPERCVIIIMIYHSNDASQPHIHEMNMKIET